MPNTPPALQDLVFNVQIVAIRPAGSGESGVSFTAVVQNVVDPVLQVQPGPGTSVSTCGFRPHFIAITYLLEI